jgi:hypothetical protein
VPGDANEIAPVLLKLKLFCGRSGYLKHFIKRFGTVLLFFRGACFPEHFVFFLFGAGIGLMRIGFGIKIPYVGKKGGKFPPF